MSSDQTFQNGKYKLQVFQKEMRMSHWLNAPLLTDTESGDILLDLSENIWDLRSATEAPGKIILTLARYPDGNKEYVVTLMPEQKRGIVQDVEYPIEKVAEAITAIV